MPYRVTCKFVADRLYLPGEIIDLDEAAAAGANAVQPGLLVPLDVTGNAITLPMIDIVVGDPTIFEDVATVDAYMPPFRGDKHLVDLPMMLQIALHLDPKHILEIGTAHGNAAYNLAAYCPSANIITVNALPDQIKGRNITSAFSKDEIGRVFRDKPEAERIRQVYADSKNLTKKELGLKSAELVIIDGCHDFDYVISDFAVALRMLPATNSVILIHDALPTGLFPEVHDACIRLREKGHDIRAIEGTSWAMYCADFMTSPWNELVEEVA